ncbi:MAG: hypothetical protein KVP17_003842 [Porospora cf. gigantea B]|uniref:uncharacterized protein n=1 Tax=Porospora cf. gigantea B TaxID=2853592 RepID=UPI0035718665|nr:MAG: hypothetical protein KVP17_003842 [Porospora cf. gigantea B]
MCTPDPAEQLIQAILLQRVPTQQIRSQETLDQFKPPSESVELVLKHAADTAFGLIRAAHESADGTPINPTHVLQAVVEDRETHHRMKKVLSHMKQLRSMTAYFEGDAGRTDLGFTAAQAFSPLPPPPSGAGPGRPRNPDVASRV